MILVPLGPAQRNGGKGAEEEEEEGQKQNNTTKKHTSGQHQHRPSTTSTRKRERWRGRRKNTCRQEDGGKEEETSIWGGVRRAGGWARKIRDTIQKNSESLITLFSFPSPALSALAQGGFFLAVWEQLHICSVSDCKKVREILEDDWKTFSNTTHILYMNTHIRYMHICSNGYMFQHAHIVHWNQNQQEGKHSVV